MHLEAITNGKLLDMGYQNRLSINVPPAYDEVAFDLRLLAQRGTGRINPSLQFLTTSYKEDNCKRDTSRMRDLVCSEWYQALWGKPHEVDGKMVAGVEMAAVGETRISNKAGGWREGMPFGSLQGLRADRLIIDDAHSIDTAESDAQRARTALRFKELVPYRINDPEKSAIVVIMQRLHVERHLRRHRES